LCFLAPIPESSVGGAVASMKAKPKSSRSHSALLIISMATPYGPILAGLVRVGAWAASFHWVEAALCVSLLVERPLLFPAAKDIIGAMGFAGSHEAGGLPMALAAKLIASASRVTLNTKESRP